MTTRHKRQIEMSDDAAFSAGLIVISVLVVLLALGAWAIFALLVFL